MTVKQKISIPKVTIGSEGQITLPEEALEALALKPGDQVRLFILEGELRVLPVRSLEQLAGSLRYDGPPKSLEDFDEAITQKVSERARR